MMFEKLLAESLVSHKLPTHGSEFQDKETTEGRGITVVPLGEGKTIAEHGEAADQRDQGF